jgi:PAS domain S-box-containing protein
MKIIKWLSSGLLILFSALTIILYLLNIQSGKDLPILMLFLNIIFIGISSVAIFIISSQSFIKTGSWTFIWIGTGALSFGLAMVIGPALIGNVSANIGITTHNTITLFSALLFFLAAFYNFQVSSVKDVQKRVPILIGICTSSIFIISILTLLSMENLLPVFFVEGSGGTPIRQFVLTITIILFIIAAIIFFRQYVKFKSFIIYWCSLGLSFITIGIIGLSLQKATGSPLNWAGRTSQIMGGIYLLIAAIVTLREAKIRKIPLWEEFSIFFGENEEYFKQLFQNMNEAFIIAEIITDADGVPIDYRFLEVNQAWEKGVGKSRKDVIGKTLYEVLPETDPFWVNMQGNVAITGEPVKGQKFAAIANVWTEYFVYSLKKNQFAAIYADITQQKIQEEKILSLSKFPEENPNPVFRIDRNLRILYSNKHAINLLDNLCGDGSTMPKILADPISLFINNNESNKKDSGAFEIKIGRSFYELTIVAIKNANYFNIYGKDITDLKKDEKIKIRSLYDKILKLERKRIARELHDTVSQNLFSSSLFSESILKSWKKNPANTLKNLEIINNLNSAALSDIRILLTNLMPEKILNQDLRELIERLLFSVEKKSGIKSEVILEGGHNISNKMKLEVYRIAQESLNNIVKHSKASNIVVRLRSYPQEFWLIISDNGEGFDPNNKSIKNSFGLNIMKERAKIIGASVDLKSILGEGTTITLFKKNKNSL